MINISAYPYFSYDQMIHRLCEPLKKSIDIRLYHNNDLVMNARATTHAGSGGGSFALVTSLMSSFALNPAEAAEEFKSVNITPEFAQEVLLYGDSRREAGPVRGG